MKAYALLYKHQKPKKLDGRTKMPVVKATVFTQ